MIRLVDFSPENRDLFRGLNSDLNGIAVDPSDFNVNVIADYDTFIHFS
jgi:hypothetical protein